MALSAFEAFVKNDRVDNFENGFVVPPTSRDDIRCRRIADAGATHRNDVNRTNR